VQIKGFLKKLQNLPENKKKVILWVIVAIVAVVLLFVWVDIAAKRLTAIEENFQKIKFPKVENPEIQNILENASGKNIKIEDKLLPNN
jgi:hypothetical protein